MGANQPIEERQLLSILKRAASDLGVHAWIVGGYVRDRLLGRPHLDLDLVVEVGDALSLARRFAELAGAPSPVTFERFGTAQVTLPGRLVEFVTARAESYAPDSRKPDVRHASLEEDLRRRDFTINTLLMDLEGDFRDPLGGRKDLEAKILRTPKDPLRTFADDPLRMLRGIRFAAELGFELAPDLVPAMRRLKSRLAPPVISVERIAEELRKMLDSLRPKLALELLDEADLLEVVLPELAKAALERLRFSQREIEVVTRLVRLHLRPVFFKSEWTDGAVRRLARDAGPQLDRLMALARADIAASAYPEPQKLDELQARLDAVRSERPSRLEPLITGEDIMRARGIRPGPEVGRIKQKLEELVIDGEVPPDRQAVIDYLATHPQL